MQYFEAVYVRCDAVKQSIAAILPIGNLCFVAILLVGLYDY